jgi:acyl-coenzyme A synthetase/AMP-(fatty) acid ligase
MSARQKPESIREYVGRYSDFDNRFLCDATRCVSFADVLERSTLDCDPEVLSGKSVLIYTRKQLTTALAIIDLDGIARRLVICPPDVSFEHILSIAERAEVDAVVLDQDMPAGGFEGRLPVRAGCHRTRGNSFRRRAGPTEWILMTSGTTGFPKLVVHTLATLAAAIKPGEPSGDDVVWATFYDIRRYGGLQIFLRALLGGRSLVLSESDDSATDDLLRFAAHSATHITGTPSHWRRVLMSAAAHKIKPQYIRLSGEIADQAILTRLRLAYPDATLVHAFATTEAGVGFEVRDGLEGFPCSYLEHLVTAEMKTQLASLYLRSGGVALGYLGETADTVKDAEGFVDTGDIVEQRGDRFYFLGRRNGVINVGGLKVYPEEVEASINRHPAVQNSCVRAARNPIMGAIVVADVVLRERASETTSPHEIEAQILTACRESLSRHKVPARLHFVPALSVAPTGKLARRNA